MFTFSTVNLICFSFLCCHVGVCLYFVCKKYMVGVDFNMGLVYGIPLTVLVRKKKKRKTKKCSEKRVFSVQYIPTFTSMYEIATGEHKNFCRNSDKQAK